MMLRGSLMRERLLQVHLLPQWIPPTALAGTTTVVVDVLRATTTVVHALAAGCTCVRPVAEIEEARALADALPPGTVILAGERGGLPIEGFDCGNSPLEFSRCDCRGRCVVMTTTNGTHALIRAAEAERVIAAAFVNFSAVCDQLIHDERPLHIVCAGSDGQPSLEDTLLAGAFVEVLCDHFELQLNDSARLAWDCFENQGVVLPSALEIGRGGQALKNLGFDADIAAAAEIDRFAIVPELRRNPLRLEIGAAGVVRGYWPR
jgi:2-phosphosulfolactate phosphatase